MNRALLLFGLALLAPAAHAATGWADLWATPDQRASKLLQSGDAQAAARTFVDPQRKAYAELQAGDYAAAARDYTQFSSSDDHYNRGNALAHAGDLTAAMKAYDAALARNPGNRDARHNRDLVAQAMRQKPPQPPTPNDRHAESSPKDQGKSGKEGKEGKDGKDGTNGKQTAQTGEQGSSADSSGKSPSQSGPQNAKTPQQSPSSSPPESAKASPGKSSGKGSAEQNAQQQGNQNGQAPGKEQTAQSGKPNASGAAQPDQPGRLGTPRALDDKLQAQQDAVAGVALAAGTQSNAKTSATPARDQPNLTLARTPESEQRLAQEEWLRQIPDDPGGLLRRKLMIEHMLRQPKAQP